MAAEQNNEPKKTQLARINVPNLANATAEEWNKMFNTINENFEKIASIPFLQGVKGDSYQLVIKHIFDDKQQLTKEGALLLNAIFAEKTKKAENLNNKKAVYTFTIGETALDCYNKTKDEIFSSPLLSIINGTLDEKKRMISVDAIVNNDLYFYVIVDDAGVEQEEMLGQFYYFLDGRIKDLQGKIISATGGINDFYDYSGYFQYFLSSDNMTGNFKKIDVIPSLYYDKDTQQMCWKFSGKETGIPAQGIQGEQGKDSNFKIVRVDNAKDNFGKITAVLKEINNTNYQGEYWEYGKTVADGYKCVIYNNLDSEEQHIAFGYSFTSDNKQYAYWIDESNIDKSLDTERINDYFKSLGTPNENQLGWYGVQIPACPDRNTSSDKYNTAHVIKTANYAGEKTDNNDLIFRLTKNAFSKDKAPERYENSKASVVLDNYDLVLKQVNIENTNIDNPTDIKNATQISNNYIKVGVNSADSSGIILNAEKNSEFYNIAQFRKGIEVGNYDDSTPENKTVSFGEMTTPMAIINTNSDWDQNKKLNILLSNVSSVKDENNKIQIAVTDKIETKKDADIETGITIKSNEVIISDLKQKELCARYSSLEEFSNNSYIGMPIGSIIMWYGSIISSNENEDGIKYPCGSFKNSWVVCNGKAIYAYKKFNALRDVIGLNLPNFYQAVPVGIIDLDRNGKEGIDTMGTVATEIQINASTYYNTHAIGIPNIRKRNVYYLIKYA